MKKVIETATKTNKDASEDVTKIMTENCKENNKTLSNLNNKRLEIRNDGGIIASYLLSPLSEIHNPEHTSQFKLLKDPNSNRLNDLLMN